MDYVLVNYRSGICKWIMFSFLFLYALSGMHAQNAVFKNNIQQGVVKVKFDPSMTATLSQMRIKSTGKVLSTGITRFDEAIGTIRAVKMGRLIPESLNPALEAKHRKAGLHLWYVVEFDQNVDPKTAADVLRKVPGVGKVECEYLKVIAPTEATVYKGTKDVSGSLPFNDPYLKDQWHYINNGLPGLTGEKADTNLKKVWQVTAGSSDVVVAVFDEGIDVNHEDLKGNIWVNTKEIAGDGIDNDVNGYIDDVNGFNFTKLTGNIDAMSHGTHVAGTVGAVNNNGIGVSGVAGGTGKGDGVKIMSMQILNGATAGYIFKAYIYAADMGAVISQNSWGYQSPGVYEADVLAGIDYFIDHAGDYPGSPMKGGIVIFAAGNEFLDDAFWPGIYERCFAVSSIGPEWKIASYSNYGKWVEISAPGGDQSTYGMVKAGVLSTLPGNQYGYMNGTSMACPHVSGIAALALANRTKQLTNNELWNILLTSVKNIDSHNPNFTGKLGRGAIDAELAIRINKGIAPGQITSLAVKGIAQEFVNLEWPVPADSDDDIPVLFNIYYSTEPLSETNLSKASLLKLENMKPAGEIVAYEIGNLLGTMKYYFGVISVDRWGNKSILSNVITGTTNNGPSINVNTGSVDKSISLVAQVGSSAISTKQFSLLNESEGLLRWEYEVRNTGLTLSAATFPVITAMPKGIGTKEAKAMPAVRNTEPVARASFSPITKKYIQYSSTVFIGDTDPSIPTSGAVKFIVTEDNGFNLTQIQTDVNYTLGTGPIIIQVYEGALEKGKLRRTQEYQPTSSWITSHNIALDEHIYFEKGQEFYVVVHVPGGNGYSLGIAPETSPEYSDYCFFSDNYGATWKLLSNAGISQSYAWGIAAVSQMPNMSQYLVLNPASGNVAGKSEETISIQADGSALINGSYKANVIFKSNDSKNAEYRIPVTFNVSGHKPNIVYPRIVEFGSVFKNAETTVDIVLENTGYGLVKSLNASVDNPQFEVVGQTGQVDARSESVIRVSFKPTTSGNINGKLTISNGTYSYTLSLFGVGAETSEIEVSPLTATIDSIAIGDIVTREVMIKNNGGFPLEYFIPGFDDQGISSDWPDDYHSYGYTVRSSDSRLDPATSLTYQFNDISATGVDITGYFIDNFFKEVSFGFDFPYYGVNQSKIYITKNGFTTFDDKAKPYNSPKLHGDLKGYISLMGYSNSVNLADAKILYKIESDRFILQYTNAKYSNEPFTGQIVLFANGNIRFYYKELAEASWVKDGMIVMIEDVAQNDGIMVRNRGDFAIEKATVIGFDYPGPDIITSVENGSGIIAPGESVIAKAVMDTRSLPEGVILRNLSIISNDPVNPAASYSTTLNVTKGGTVDYSVSADMIDFGVVYENFPYEKEFSIKNNGSKQVSISSIVSDNSKFTVSGDMIIEPGINAIYKVAPNTSAITDLTDTLQINFPDGKVQKISLKALVRSVPVFTADLTPVSASLNLNENKTFPFEIQNTGGSDLEVSVIGGQWFKLDAAASAIKHDYHVKTENNGEPSYNWLNILKTGTKLPYDPSNNQNKNVFWKEIILPFTFTYYGMECDTIKVGDNGIIAIGGDPDAMPYPSESLPITYKGSDFLCPLWSPGSFDTYNYPDEAGLYYQVYEDKVVISWMYFVNLFGWGESFQVILYKDGLIKYQYKLTDGVSNGTSSGTVGVQKAGGEEFIVLSNRSALPLGKGLAYVIVPDKKQVLKPKEKLGGNIILDAANIYGGTFSDNLLFKTNSPATPEILKPVSVTVAGTAFVDAPTAINLGDTEVVFDKVESAYKSISKPLIITNTGTAPVRITNARMETGGKYLTQLVLSAGMLGATWTPIEGLWGGYPQQFLLPGSSFKSYVRFQPQVPGTYEDVLILTTSEGDIRVELKGFGYKSPVINVDNTPINVSFNTADEATERSIIFDNKDGGYKLDYNVSVNYERKPIASTASVRNEVMSKTRMNALTPELNVATLDKKSLNSITTHADEFNRKMQYISETGINNGMGHNGSTATIAATRFVADKTGFTLSDVGSYVTLDKGVSGTIKVEVRAGGTNISNAVTIASGSFEFSFPEDHDERQVIMKKNYTFAKPAQILPNEEFYVIFTYPMDLTYPQTIQLRNVPITAGRYLWFADGEWYDMQDYLSSIGADPASGCVMYAAERKLEESGWLKILTPDTGTLQMGESTKTDIKFVASFAEKGDQKARVVIKSNDVNASVVEIPVALHMNEAPFFNEAPSTLMIAEKETETLNINVTDKENNTFTVEITDKPEFVTSSVEAGKVSFSVAPDYGHAGDYAVKMKATDEYNAVKEHNISI
ncbi:MAG: S8 family serine peptidase, partial [Prevotella sp.]|nr:S8 family serine peptidase [Prevotella sp.]